VSPDHVKRLEDRNLLQIYELAHYLHTAVTVKPGLTGFLMRSKNLTIPFD